MRRTGGYSEAFRLLGVTMGCAAIMAWGTRSWQKKGMWVEGVAG